MIFITVKTPPIIAQTEVMKWLNGIDFLRFWTYIVFLQGKFQFSKLPQQLHWYIESTNTTTVWRNSKTTLADNWVYQEGWEFVDQEHARQSAQLFVTHHNILVVLLNTVVMRILAFVDIFFRSFFLNFDFFFPEFNAASSDKKIILTILGIVNKQILSTTNYTSLPVQPHGRNQLDVVVKHESATVNDLAGTFFSRVFGGTRPFENYYFMPM